MSAADSVAAALAARLDETHARLCNELLQARRKDGAWTGRLSSSALATAVSVFGLASLDPHAHRDLIAAGLDWLCAHANPDGGWGDTPASASNVSTTLLCWSALNAASDGGAARYAAGDHAAHWLRNVIGSLEPAAIVRHVAHRYGKDRTFSAPILAMCALAGRLGSGRDAWRDVPQLPFELAVLPHRCFRMLRLHVVSYALPALIAVGLMHHRLLPARSFVRRRLRDAATPRVLTVLQRLQPPNGGFLEAPPLTAFVLMSLCACRLHDHRVAQHCARFLCATARHDGSWPIDTNLATWVTTLAINGLAEASSHNPLASAERASLLTLLLEQQHVTRHPFTHTAPGGWAWTNLPGSVPDADDTSGVLRALQWLAPDDERVRAAAHAGLQWLLRLQNRDGGIPTFCRGWGALPFDRSCPDITAHAVRAWTVWRHCCTAAMQRTLQIATRRGLRFLERAQRPDGAWIPLWFGNEKAPRHENPTYGTAQVVLALQELENNGVKHAAGLRSAGCAWLRGAQRADGGWGGAPHTAASLEETALAVAALADDANSRKHVRRGVLWLLDAFDRPARMPAAPIGLYFASLWYSEELYPLVFGIAALGRARRALGFNGVCPVQRDPLGPLQAGEPLL